MIVQSDELPAFLFGYMDLLVLLEIYPVGIAKSLLCSLHCYQLFYVSLCRISSLSFSSLNRNIASIIFRQETQNWGCLRVSSPLVSASLVPHDIGTRTSTSRCIYRVDSSSGSIKNLRHHLLRIWAIASASLIPNIGSFQLSLSPLS